MKQDNRNKKEVDAKTQKFILYLKAKAQKLGKDPSQYVAELKKNGKLEEEYKNFTLKAEKGAKLNYFKSLKHQCAEDEELYYYKKGGSVDCGCKKKEDGGQVNKASIGGIVERFKNRTKQKIEEAKKLADKKEADEAFKKHRMIPGKHLPRGNNNVTEAERKDVTRDKCGSKIKKHQEGSVIAKFKAYHNGGSLNGIPFIKKVL